MGECSRCASRLARHSFSATRWAASRAWSGARIEQDGLAGFRDHHFLALPDLFEQTGEMRLRLMNTDFRRLFNLAK